MTVESNIAIETSGTNLYELLGIRSDSTPLEVQRASEAIIKTFQRDELATYSLIDTDEQRNAFLRDIERAATILLDRDSRTAYDETHGIVARYTWPQQGVLHTPPVADKLPEPAPASEATISSPAPRQDVPAPAEPAPVPARPEVAADQRDLQTMLAEAERVDGALLQALREAAGRTRKEVSDNLKISMTQLTALEEMNPNRLPAEVYTRGFVRSYARLLRVDQNQLTSAYMEEFKKQQGANA